MPGIPLGIITVADVPREYGNAVTVAGIAVRMVPQRTGFGWRRYFLCPSCGRKCAKLHQIVEGLHCQSCSPVDLYAYRRGLYDEDSHHLIVWHMHKLAATINDEPIQYPYHYFNYPIEPPQGMSHERYRKTLLRLQILENMRYAAIAHGCRFTGADIRHYISERFISLFDLWQVADYQIFGTEVPPEYYCVLLSEDKAPTIPPWRSRPARVIIRDVEEVRRVLAKYDGVLGVRG